MSDTINDITDVVRRIDRISERKDDWEAAHSMEDNLYKDVLRAIANGASDPRALATMALVTEGIDFPRHYA